MLIISMPSLSPSVSESSPDIMSIIYAKHAAGKLKERYLISPYSLSVSVSLSVLSVCLSFLSLSLSLRSLMDESNVTMTITALTKVSHFFPSNIHLESDCYLMLYEEIKKPSEVRLRTQHKIQHTRK